MYKIGKTKRMIMTGKSSKGQSAIEYLTTYGWMMLAVAIVGGIAYSNIQATCTRSTSDFYTDAIAINDFGIGGEGNFVLSLKNDRYTEIEFTKLNVTIDDQSKWKNPDKNLTSGESKQVKISGFQSTDACNTLDVRLTFNRGQLKDQKVTGFIRAPIGFN